MTLRLVDCKSFSLDGEKILSINSGQGRVSLGDVVALRYLSDYAKVEGLVLKDIGRVVKIVPEDRYHSSDVILVHWARGNRRVRMKPDEIKVVRPAHTWNHRPPA